MSDTITINTSTESVNLTVVVDGRFAYWGTIFGVLSAQTDLWRVLSAKALEVDLQGLSGQVIDLETFIAAVSSSWNGGQEALTVLAGNSAFWDTAFARSTVFSSVSSRYDSSSTVVESNSGNWSYAYDTAASYSSISGTFATNSTVNSVSSLLTPLTLTNTLTSQLVLNTAFNNFQTSVGQATATLLPTSTYQQASGNWQDAFTNVQSNSANWNFGYDVATYVQANSANWEESSEIIPTVTNYLSTVPVALSSVDVKGQLLSAGTDLFDIFLTSETDSQTLIYVPSSYDLSISNGNTVNLSSINTTFAANSGKYENVYSNVVSNSANWDNAYNTGTVYQSNSATYATNTLLQSTSALLTPLTLTNNLTSQLVLNTDFNNYRTEVATATATLLPTTTYQNASGNWQGTFTNVQSNSANWNTAFDRSTVFSSVSGRYNSSSTVVESNSANWNTAFSVATTYQTASSTFATNTLLQSTSALLTPLTLTNTLTSQLVLNTDFDSYKTNVASATGTLVLNTDFDSYKTNVAASTATLLPITTYQSASGDFATNTLLQSTSALLVNKNTNTYIIAQPGDNLITKYAEAAALTPNGNAKSASNRASLIIMPGFYTLSATLNVNVEFVDIIGIGAQKLNRGAVPAVTLSYAGGGGESLWVTANNVRIKGIGTDNVGSIGIGENLPLQIFEDCVASHDSFGFVTGNVAGTFINCKAGDGSFGVGGNASGTFINCEAGNYSFGHAYDDVGYSASGFFKNCKGGSYNFGCNDYSEASGTFEDCEGGYASFGGNGGASGVFKNCVGDQSSFAGMGFLQGQGNTSGTFMNCIGGQDSFGSFTMGANRAGKLYNCRLTAGTFKPVTAGGLLRNCIDGNNNLVNE